MNRNEDIITVNRRSDRSVARLVNGQQIGDLDLEKTALLISLCQCSGWSAENICLTFKKFYDIHLKPEEVWSFFWQWIMSRDAKNHSEILDSEIELMVFLMRSADFGVHGGIGRPLSQTVQPVTVDFCKKWCPKKGDRSLCKGFTKESRDAAKKWLYSQKIRAWETLAPTEQVIVERFGSTVEHIVKDVMQRWSVDLEKLLNVDTRIRRLKEEKHVNLILHYLDVYTELWEDKFGIMEEVEGEVKGTVSIQSTGYGVKVLLGLLMADRLNVIDFIRKEERLRIGFEKVGPETLAEDAKMCPICQDEMGIQTPEGSNEAPLTLVICCGQGIGEKCLKTWLGLPVHGQLKTTCPCCRFKFPESFLQKLFGDEYAQKKALEDIEEDSEWELDEAGAGSGNPPPLVASPMIEHAHAHPHLLSYSQQPAFQPHQISPAEFTRLVFMAPLQSADQIPVLQAAPIVWPNAPGIHPNAPGINANIGINLHISHAPTMLPSIDELADRDDFMMEG